MQLHVPECYFFCVLVWEDQGLLQYPPCVVRASERSLALLLSHSCSQHLSSHWCWPPWPAADPSLLSLICPKEFLLPAFFNQNQPTTIICFYFFFKSKNCSDFSWDTSLGVSSLSNYAHVILCNTLWCLTPLRVTSFFGFGVVTCVSALIWSYIERVLGKCIPLLHWQQM